MGEINNRKYHKIDPQRLIQVKEPEMAYIIGFIAADGNISKDLGTLQINLQARDKEILQQIKKVLNINHPIKSYKTKLKNGKKYPTITLSICDKEAIKGLILHNVVPKKSLILKPSRKIPANLINHYLRGYWDGDGSISFTFPSSSPVKIQVCSGSPVFISFIKKTLEQAGIKVSDVSKRGNVSIIRIFQSGNNIINFFNYLYNNSNIHLKRKRQTTLKILYWLAHSKQITERNRSNKLLTKELLINTIKEKKSIQKLSQQLKIDNSTIHRYIKKFKLVGWPYERIKPKGENNGNSKLNNDSVIQIRDLYNNGIYTQAEVSKKFNLSPTHVNKIVHNLLWKHI